MATTPGPLKASTLQLTGALGIDGATPGTHGIAIPAATPSVVTSKLYSPDGAALYYNGSPLATGSSVSGTTGKLAKFTAPTTLGDSIITESGTTVTVANTLNATSLGGTLTTAAQTAITSVGTLTGGATGAGFTIAIGTSTVTGNIPSANVTGSYTGITGVGTLTAGATGAGFTIALSTSNVTGTLSATRGGTNLDTSGSTGVAQVAAGTWSVTTTLQNAVQDNITRLGTVTMGSFPAANLTGTTLASNVVTSSLTTVGTITSGVWNAGALTSSGILTVNGFGTHTFSASSNSNNSIKVENTNTGNGAIAGLQLANNTGTLGFWRLFGSNYSTSGINIASSVLLESDGANGLTLAATDGSGGDVRIYNRNALALSFGASQAATFTGQVQIPSGLVGTPALAFSTDTDTGIFRNGSNSLSFAIDGAEVFKFRGQAVSPAILITSSGAPNGVLSFSGGTGTGSSISAGDNVLTVNTGTFIIGGTPQATVDGTGAGSALLGANSPASTLTAPYTWLTMKSSDGSTVYVPAWK